MTDITPLTAIDRLQGKDAKDRSLLTDISQTLGSVTKRGRSERWKQKLREDLVCEHIAAQQKKDTKFRSFVHKLFKKG